MSNTVAGDFTLQGKKEDLLKVFGAYIKTGELDKDELTEAFRFKEAEDEVTIHIPEKTILLIDDKRRGILVKNVTLKKIEGVWTLFGRILGQDSIDLLYFSDLAYDFNLKGTAYAGDQMLVWKDEIVVDNKELKKYGQFTLSTGEYQDFLNPTIKPDSLY